jgi:hypothetical protein
MKPLDVKPRQSLSEPCVLKASKYGYIANISRGSASFTKDAGKAKVFKDSDEAYLALASFGGGLSAQVVAQRKLAARADKPRNVVLSVRSGSGFRHYVFKLTGRALHYTDAARAAKCFASEKEAMRWYEQRIVGRFTGVCDPKTEVVANA